MTPAAKIRLQKLIWILLLVAGITSFILTLSKPHIIYYQLPSEAPRIGTVRIGGTVKNLQNHSHSPRTTFDICDQKACISVCYDGEIPRLLAENKEALIEGSFQGRILIGTRALAKHDERYERRQ